MNTRRKGNRTVRKGIEILESRGFEVGIVERVGKHIKVKDLFGLFDCIALKRGTITFIQFKTNRKPPFKPYKTFAERHPGVFVDVWVWYDCQGFKIWTIWQDKKINIVTESIPSATKIVRKKSLAR